MGPEIEAVAAALTEGTSEQALGGWCPGLGSASACGSGSGRYEDGHLALEAGAGLASLVHFMTQGDSSELLTARGDAALSQPVPGLSALFCLLDVLQT